MDDQKALEWITDALTVKDRVLTLDDSRMSVWEWDSMGDLLLLSRLQEDYGIVISADDAAKIKTVREVIELVQKNHSSVS